MNDARIGFSPEGKFKQKLTDKIHNGLKCYEIIDGKITAISFVDTPANGVMAKIISYNERIIAGLILIADKMIYRINPITGEEYYIYFTKNIIEKLFKDYHNEKWTTNELKILFNLYTSGKSIEEIAQGLNRTQDNVEGKLNEIDRIPLEILRMTNMRMNIMEICDKLGLDIEQLIEIIKKMGGTIEFL